ncbi:hypothetical protein Tco_0099509 [Tanacetum coccineum]
MADRHRDDGQNVTRPIEVIDDAIVHGGIFLDQNYLKAVALAIIESKDQKVRYSRCRANVSRVSTVLLFLILHLLINSFDMQQRAFSLRRDDYQRNKMLNDEKLSCYSCTVKAVERFTMSLKRKQVVFQKMMLGFSKVILATNLQVSSSLPLQYHSKPTEEPRQLQLVVVFPYDGPPDSTAVVEKESDGDQRIRATSTEDINLSFVL